MNRLFRWLEAEAIDAADATFRVRTLHDAALKESIARHGVRAPLLLVAARDESAGGKHRLVSGWGRWLARREGEPLPCFILPPESPEEELWDAFLKENDSWNVVEEARILRGLAAVPGLTAERIVKEKLPLLGLHPSMDLYRRHLRLLELSAEALGFIEAERLPLRRAVLFLKLPAGALEQLLSRHGELHFTWSELAEVLGMVSEIAERDGVGAASVLQELEAAPERSSKEAFRRRLRDRRYPEHSRFGARLEELKRQVSFSVPVKIEWDPRLERPGIRIVAELADRDAAAAFERELAANREALARFFEVL